MKFDGDFLIIEKKDLRRIKIFITSDGKEIRELIIECDWETKIDTDDFGNESIWREYYPVDVTVVYEDEEEVVMDYADFLNFVRKEWGREVKEELEELIVWRLKEESVESVEFYFKGFKKI